MNELWQYFPKICIFEGVQNAKTSLPTIHKLKAISKWILCCFPSISETNWTIVSSLSRDFLFLLVQRPVNSGGILFISITWLQDSLLYGEMFYTKPTPFSSQAYLLGLMVFINRSDTVEHHKSKCISRVNKSFNKRAAAFEATTRSIPAHYVQSYPQLEPYADGRIRRRTHRTHYASYIFAYGIH